MPVLQASQPQSGIMRRRLRDPERCEEQSLGQGHAGFGGTDDALMIGWRINVSVTIVTSCPSACNPAASCAVADAMPFAVVPCPARLE